MLVIFITPQMYNIFLENPTQCVKFNVFARAGAPASLRCTDILSQTTLLSSAENRGWFSGKFSLPLSLKMNNDDNIIHIKQRGRMSAKQKP